MKKKIRDWKLLAAFGIFIILTVMIGTLGIIQIYSLTETIRELGYRQLPREKIVFEMKMNNEIYALGIRNYILRHIANPQEPAPQPDIPRIERASFDFRKYLSLYEPFAATEQQMRWSKFLEAGITKLEGMGKELFEQAKTPGADAGRINQLLNDFDDQFYEIDDFLSNTLSKENLQEIEAQLQLANTRRDASLLILIVSTIASIILGIFITTFVYSHFKMERLRREMLVQRMIRLEEEERRNLSSQIHDQLSQDLGALKIHLELISNAMSSEQGEQKGKIEKSREILASLIDKGHNISELLRPSELDELGLVESIDFLIKRCKEITGCRFHYYKPQTEINVFPEYSLALYRVTQEALTNIAKHAQSQNVTISLQQKGNVLHLMIQDDGMGFNYRQYLRRPRRRREDKLKLGLIGLRERIELLGGRLNINTSPGKGTKIEVELNV